ncbi:MAG TPA: TIGR02147 family protein [Bdellovibrionales bacterium]|nr:TIGR02147 family protein [Bdellovibrionales bacterium]
MNLFEFRSYRAYLKAFIEVQPNGGRGWGARLAQAAGCHTSFVSQVLAGKTDFSLEQAYKIAGLLGLSPDETEFFLTLVSAERTGTIELRKYFEEKLERFAEKRRQIVNRIGKTSQLSLENQLKYYSSWHHAAVHVLLAISDMRSLDKLAAVTKLAPARLSEVLEDLSQMGLIRRAGSFWERTEKQLHLPAKSPMIKKHHQNWRLKALDAIDEPKTHDLHYSSLVGIAREDAEKIREALLAAVSSVRSIVRDSPEEGVYCYSLDFFEIG